MESFSFHLAPSCFLPPPRALHPNPSDFRATWEWNIDTFRRLSRSYCKFSTRSSVHLTFSQGQNLASDLTHFALWRNPNLLTELISTLGKKCCVQIQLSGFSFLLFPHPPIFLFCGRTLIPWRQDKVCVYSEKSQCSKSNSRSSCPP